MSFVLLFCSFLSLIKTYVIYLFNVFIFPQYDSLLYISLQSTAIRAQLLEDVTEALWLTRTPTQSVPPLTDLDVG